MKSFTTLSNYFTDKSQNTATTNVTRGKELINDQHRYLLQKYFDNLQSAIVGTVGSQDLTATGTFAVAATTGTLTASWSYPTGQSYVNFSSGEQRLVTFTNGSTAMTWSGGLTETATTAITSLGLQGYSIPANISKVKDMTVNVGQLKFTPSPILTQADWDTVNFLPYNSDIPLYYYIYAGKLNIFPIPSTTGNLITFNYKLRVADMTYSDYSTGTVGGTAGSTAIAGASTDWAVTGTYPTGVDLTFANLFISINPPKGDGIWYQIRSFTSGTALVLVNPLVNAPNMASGASYTIGQFPLLSEDFHDMLPFGGLMVYFNAIKKDANQYKLFKDLYTDRLDLLKDYAGTRQVNVDLGGTPQIVNPNLFLFSNS
jgi:hypothetical protein